MDGDSTTDRLQTAGITAWRAGVLGIAAVFVLVLYLGMAYLVSRGQVSDGPLILFTGVILGYVLRSVRGLV
ncbi:hypothetical protein [Natronomonas sp. EA1]|uniref:hypothetical protein n=1 Tax=Natronomonas sp. EA1 TaxID=3421655 RepID=UPI003EC13398